MFVLPNFAVFYSSYGYVRVGFAQYTILFSLPSSKDSVSHRLGFMHRK